MTRDRGGISGEAVQRDDGLAGESRSTVARECSTCRNREIRLLELLIKVSGCPS